MKKIVIPTILSFVILSLNIKAQVQNVGISTTGNSPDPSAMLDVESSDKGILIPRVSLIQTTIAAPVVSPLASLMVYNTATINDIAPGFYYWSGTKWERLTNEDNVSQQINDSLITNVYPFLNNGGGSSNDLDTIVGNEWSILGNTGTNQNTNFIGTTDNVGLTVRLNNTEKWRFAPNGTLYPLNTGNSIFIGSGSGENDDLSNNTNVFIGLNSGHENTTGSQNIFVGSAAGANNTTGVNNSFLGSAVGVLNTTGSANVFLGGSSGYANTTGSQNVFIGISAGSANTTGTRNVGIGFQSLQDATSTDNTAVGYAALRELTTGYANLAVGGWALKECTTGSSNTSIGQGSLSDVTIGSNNVAVGSSALNSSVDGQRNTAIGLSAYGTSTSGNDNVALGYHSNSTVTGSQNLSFGNSTNSGMGYITRTNSIAIGHFASADNNEAHIGNTSTTEIGGFQNWTNISDGRFKKNINEDVIGLDFIRLLRPVNYNLEINKLNEFMSISDTVFTSEQVNNASRLIHTGFIAQEVEEAAQKSSYNFSGVHSPIDKNDTYGLKYAEFVVPLVKAVQELEEIVLKQQKLIEELLNK